jgi:hypothetical protein
MTIYTTESYIVKVSPVHNFFFDYSDTIFKTVNDYISIICPLHGPFVQRANAHLSGQGCPHPECRNVKISKSKYSNTNDFINKANIKHNFFFDYSLTVYINCYTNVIIICPKHGQFNQNPSDHLAEEVCPFCIKEETRRNTLESFIIRATIKYDGKFDYSLVVYLSNRIKVKIICPKHRIFEQTPNNHLRSGNCGCNLCGIEETGRKRLRFSSTEEFVSFAIDKYGDKFDYSLVEYFDMKTPITIVCKIHGPFCQTPLSHLDGRIRNSDERGYGCPKCKETTGERAVRKELSEQVNINFDSQHWFEDCRNIHPLRFDFVIFDEDKNVKALIEYQGEQHYIPIKYNKKVSDEQALANLLLNQHRDKIKQSYCTQNNIPLLIIPYTNLKNISNLIQDFLHKY